MYFYLVSFGEYEQYDEITLVHEKRFNEEEFDSMVIESAMDIERLCEKHGFKKIEIQAHHHSD